MKGIFGKVRRAAALCACLTVAVGALVGCGGGERDDPDSVPAAETSSELFPDGSESSEAEKVYTITYDLGVNRYATLKSESTRAVFGESFTLEIPEYEGSAAFYGWYLADENGGRHQRAGGGRSIYLYAGYSRRRPLAGMVGRRELKGTENKAMP